MEGESRPRRGRGRGYSKEARRGDAATRERGYSVETSRRGRQRRYPVDTNRGHAAAGNVDIPWRTTPPRRSAAVRSVDDAAARGKETVVLAGGDRLVAKTSLPAALLDCFALVLDAKRALEDMPLLGADEKIQLCRTVVRKAVDGAEGDDAVCGALLRAAAAMRERFPRYEESMDEVFVNVVEDRFGAFEDNLLSDHLLPTSDEGLLADREDQPGRWY